MKTIFAAFGFLILLSAFSSPKPRTEALKNCSEVNSRLYISQSEVSVEDYLSFLKGLIDEGRGEEVSDYAPDADVWDDLGGFLDPLKSTYDHHPAFRAYPVVGISHEAAIAYCDWLTRKYKTRNYSNGKFSGSTYYKFRLPTLSEWEEVGKAGSSSSVYPGGWNSVQNEKGEYYFNFRPMEDNYLADNFMFTAPVKPKYKSQSLRADEDGIWQMGGNVAEMVAEKGISKGGSWYHSAEFLKIESVLNYEKPTAWLGFRYVVEILNVPEKL